MWANEERLGLAVVAVVDGDLTEIAGEGFWSDRQNAQEKFLATLRLTSQH